MMRRGMSKQEKSRKRPESCGRIECERARAQWEMQASACTHRCAKGHRASLCSILLVCILSLVLSSCNKDVVPHASEDAREQDTAVSQTGEIKGFSLQDVPVYDGGPYAEVNGNVPYFQEKEFTTTAFKKFSMLDKLGRCGVVKACLGPETMPTEPRESIGMIKPSGWHTVKYDGIDGNYLYNRCHLIGYQLCGENANELNLITGTRYMNTQGMEPFECDTAYYMKRTGNHVLYRVTPLFKGNDLVVTGVLMEARSVEEDDFAFCIFCYNVQPGIVIDYSSGESWLE